MANSRDRNQYGDGIETTPVLRTTLASGVEIRGTLEYESSEELAGATGVVTKVPEAGSVHKAGEPLLEIEGNPVFILHGEIPLWRDLSAGMSGIDVDTLRAALTDLGYSAGNTAAATPFDSSLAGAIDALYAKGGYPAPSTRPASVTARDEASQELASAEEAVASAQQALREARRGPSKKDLTDANNAIAAARRALTAAQQCTASQRADSPEPGGPCDVDAAREALASAEAGKADLTAARDTSAEGAAVANAQSVLNAARLKANQAALSSVGPKDILLVPTEEMRVDQVKAKVGQSAEGPVVTWTSTAVHASADLTDAQRKLLVAGTQVDVTLPDGVTVVTGVVGDVSSTRQDPDTGEMIPPRVRIDIEDQEALALSGIGGVTITMIADEAEGVLVVPVTALLALAGGGYAVELPDGELIRVEVGMIQDTRAEISTADDRLKEGDEVVVV
jgi:hypothetical protein